MTKVFRSETFQLVFDAGDVSLTRKEFRKLGRDAQLFLTGLGYNWSHNLANALGEMIKNIYDHGNRQGSITITVFNNGEATWEVKNATGGDEAGRTMNAIIEHVAKHGSSRPDTKDLPDGNCGIGLISMIKPGLDALAMCPGVIRSTWEFDSKNCFTYKGQISFTPKTPK